ncbi:MAG: hypothetical protein SGILL_007941, partial [Bacillariaceae sp.]
MLLFYCNISFLQQQHYKQFENAGLTVLQDHGSKQQRTRSSRKAVMVLAAVPLDKRHVVALWSELSCFTQHIDHVLLASPNWSQPIIDKLLEKVRTEIPPFASKQVTISAQFFENDRYDIGLWCDGMSTLPEEEYDDVILLNDSLFALRNFSGVLDTLRDDNFRMTSLSYSATDPKGIWLESVFRGFDREGLKTFRDYACVPKEHPLFCPKEVSRVNLKRCFTDHFEIDIARLYKPEEVKGLYLSDVPKDQWMEHRPWATWVVHTPYWANTMVAQWDFPAAKVTKRNMIRNFQHPWIQNCTKGLDWDMVNGFNYSSDMRKIKKRPRHRGEAYQPIGQIQK